MRSRTARIGLAVAAACAIVGCGTSDGEASNLELAAALTDLPGLISTTDVASETYCRSDTCLSGDDGTTTKIDFVLERPRTPDEFAAELEQRMPDWLVTAIDCSAAEADCNGIGALSLERGELSLYVDLSTTSTGTIFADAET